MLVAGGGTGETGVPATEAKLDEPFGVALGPEQTLYLIEMAANRLRRIDAAGLLTTVAGNGAKGYGGDGGPALEAQLDGPHHIVTAPGQRRVFIADTGNNRVRTFDPASGMIETFAGTGEKAFGGDGGPAKEAQFDGIYCLAFDATAANLYLADLGNRRIRRIDMATNVVTTVAGNGEKGVPADGTQATAAPLVDPRAVAVDSKGNVYIAERGGHALRLVDLAGKIWTVAGTGQEGAGGDGGPALSAQFDGPKHLTVDRDDSVLIVDTENHAIRRYDPVKKVVTLVAGTGQPGPAGINRPLAELELNRPHGVLVDPAGDLLISDSDNHRVVKIMR